VEGDGVQGVAPQDAWAEQHCEGLNKQELLCLPVLRIQGTVAPPLRTALLCNLRVTCVHKGI
jgi:hypothetical protein